MKDNRKTGRRVTGWDLIGTICLAVVLVGALVLGGICLTGCSLNGPILPVNPENVSITVDGATPAVAGIHRRAVVWGLDHVDPQSYGGWNGDCPGTILDALRMKALLERRGYLVCLLTNEQATAFRVTAACVAAAQRMKAGDRLVAYGSSHGGQALDLNGDENGGKDSTICLWDGQFTDDLVGELLLRIRENIDVDLILDCCNSGTMYRGPHDYVRIFKARKQAKGFDIKCNLTYYGGCADGKSSYGGDDGGAFTKALLSPGPEGLTRARWFESARMRMPRNQIPIFANFGPKNVTAEGALK